MIWTQPKQFVLAKTIWWVKNHFGPIEGQGINVNKNFNSSCRFKTLLYFQCQKWKVFVNYPYPSASWAFKRQKWKWLHLSVEGSWFYFIGRKPNNCNVWLRTDLPRSAWHLQILVAPKKPQKTKTKPLLPPKKHQISQTFYTRCAFLAQNLEFEFFEVCLQKFFELLDVHS